MSRRLERIFFVILEAWMCLKLEGKACEAYGRDDDDDDDGVLSNGRAVGERQKK